MKVILISGRMGSGKTYLANELKDELGSETKIMAFADPLKAITVNIFQLLFNRDITETMEQLKRDNTQLRAIFASELLPILCMNLLFAVIQTVGSMLEAPFPMSGLIVAFCNLSVLAYIFHKSHSFTIRHVLQYLGTDILRKQLTSDIFAQSAHQRAKSSKAEYVIFQDCRFQGELDVFYQLSKADPTVKVLFVSIYCAFHVSGVDTQISTHMIQSIAMIFGNL